MYFYGLEDYSAAGWQLRVLRERYLCFGCDKRFRLHLLITTIWNIIPDGKCFTEESLSCQHGTSRCLEIKFVNWCGSFIEPMRGASIYLFDAFVDRGTIFWQYEWWLSDVRLLERFFLSTWASELQMHSLLDRKKKEPGVGIDLSVSLFPQAARMFSCVGCFWVLLSSALVAVCSFSFISPAWIVKDHLKNKDSVSFGLLWHCSESMDHMYRCYTFGGLGRFDEIPSSSWQVKWCEKYDVI